MAITSPRATARKLLNVVEFWDPSSVEAVAEWCREIAQVVNLILDGKSNATGTVTLTVSSATTTLSDRRIGIDTVVHFEPTTANAKSEGTPWQNGHGNGVVTLNHANNSQSDRSYRYSILG